MDNREYIDRMNLRRVKSLAKQELRKQQAKAVTEALYALSPDAVLLSITTKLPDRENGEQVRVRLAVASKGARRQLVGWGATRHEAVMAAIGNGYQLMLEESD